MNINDMVADLFASIDSKDAGKFSEFITEDGSFKFSNADPVVGRAAIKEYVAGFFAALDGLSHKLQTTVVGDGAAVVRGEVTYTRLDKTKLTVPFATSLVFDGDLVKEYQIYMDSSRLFQT